MSGTKVSNLYKLFKSGQWTKMSNQTNSATVGHGDMVSSHRMFANHKYVVMEEVLMNSCRMLVVARTKEYNTFIQTSVFPPQLQDVRQTSDVDIARIVADIYGKRDDGVSNYVPYRISRSEPAVHGISVLCVPFTSEMAGMDFEVTQLISKIYPYS